MTLKQKIGKSRKLTMSIAVGFAAIVFAIGGYAIADASSSNGSSSANTSTVIPFQRGKPGPSKVVGQIPASFRAGTGTIITGKAAKKAKTAAPASYPGGTINRVVLLSNGEIWSVHIGEALGIDVEHKT